LTSKFAKYDIKNYFSEMQYGYPKNAGFVADFESVEKVPKKLTRKKLSAKKLSF
jgi:hypothetical protein